MERGVGRRNPEELRERAVRMVLEVRRETGERQGAVARVARELGVGGQSLRNWVNQAEVDSGRRPGTSSADAQRVDELESEVRELRRANDMAGSGGHRRAAAIEGKQQHEASGALDERADSAATALAEDEIALPMARHRAVVDLGGPLGDVDHPRDPSPAIDAAALLAGGAPRAKASGQLTALLAPALDEQRLVDRLVAHPHLRVVRELQR